MGKKKEEEKRLKAEELEGSKKIEVAEKMFALHLSGSIILEVSHPRSASRGGLTKQSMRLGSGPSSQ